MGNGTSEAFSRSTVAESASANHIDATSSIQTTTTTSSWEHVVAVVPISVAATNGDLGENSRCDSVPLSSTDTPSPSSLPSRTNPCFHRCSLVTRCRGLTTTKILIKLSPTLLRCVAESSSCGQPSELTHGYRSRPTPILIYHIQMTA